MSLAMRPLYMNSFQAYSSFTLCLWLNLHVAVIGLSAEPRNVSPEMLDDAELHDVFFFDADRGWAVGDRGAIWTTYDGGREWFPQTSGVTCQLKSISFIDEDNGWVAGGWSHSYSHRTTGVILQTGDGGRTWKQIPKLLLPQLRGIQFSTRSDGWAFGLPSALYPSGAFRTEDGGRSWNGVPSDVGGHFTAGDFFDSQFGGLAQRNGDLAAVKRTSIQRASAPHSGLKQVRCLRFASPDTAWAVGDGGLVLQSQDGGKRWRAPRKSLPEGTTDYFDFHAIATSKNQCWIAGSPGTIVFHSDDGGSTWTKLTTEQSLPLSSLMFLDENRGWAVGALGTILATRDGGQSWRIQKSGGQKSALLGIFSDSDLLPLELIAKEAGNDGYLTAIELLGRRDIEFSADADHDTANRVKESVVAAGGSFASTAWQFPLRQKGIGMPAESIADAWNEMHHGNGLSKFEEYVVRKIRQWRPEVVVTESSDATTTLPHLTNRTVLSAIEKAADPNAFKEQQNHTGMKPWRVKRTFSLTDDKSTATVQLVTTSLAPRLGRSLANIATNARAITSDQPQITPTIAGFRLQASNLPSSLRGRDFFSGISLQPGRGARRKLGQPLANRLDSLKTMAQKHRNIEHLLSFRDKPGNGAAWLAQVNELTNGLDPNDAVMVLYELAEQYLNTGQAKRAAHVYHVLIQRYPNSEHTERVLLWLVQYYASDEVAWNNREEERTHGKVVLANHHVESTARTAPKGNSIPVSEADKSGSGDLPQLPNEMRASRAVQLTSQSERLKPALFAEPGMRFPLAAAHRKIGSNRDAEKIYQTLAQSRLSKAWVSCAQAELWLNKPDQHAPKPMCRCESSEPKPMLDGKLNDDVWKAANYLALKSSLHDDLDWPATALLARDDEFLYFAASCRKVEQVNYPASQQPRSRDADLSARDRVEFLIDTNRDWTTYYRLVVDHRGWTRESVGNVTSWNPEWFVAHTSDKDKWTIEVAIPIQELAEVQPTDGTAWAIGVQRTVPGRGFQSWTTPAAVLPCPQGFGLLLFE